MSELGSLRARDPELVDAVVANMKRHNIGTVYEVDTPSQRSGAHAVYVGPAVRCMATIVLDRFAKGDDGPLWNDEARMSSRLVCILPDRCRLDSMYLEITEPFNGKCKGCISINATTIDTQTVVGMVERPGRSTRESCHIYDGIRVSASLWTWTEYGRLSEITSGKALLHIEYTVFPDHDGVTV